jgi:hypothetical protein
MGRSAVKSKLPDRYGNKFDQMLLSTSEASEHKSFRDKGFTAFWPIKEKRFIQDQGWLCTKSRGRTLEVIVRF